jgi:hypothetical protein
MVADALAATAVVLTAKVAVVAPAATVTLDGTETAARLEVSATAAPSDGAAAVSVTVPVEGAPLCTEAASRASEEIAG